MSDALAETFTVTVDGENYTFKIPSIKFSLEVGYKSAEIRQRAYPEFRGELGSLDMTSVMFARYCAILELYLLKATTGWPFGVADDSKFSPTATTAQPQVKFEQFPSDCEDLVFAVGQQFEAEKARFRSRRNRREQSAGAEVVAGQ